MKPSKNAAAATMLLTPALALADVSSGLQAATTWASIIFGAIGVLALMYAAAKKMWGDPTANQQLAGVVIGGIIGLGASSLMMLLRGWFGG